MTEFPNTPAGHKAAVAFVAAGKGEAIVYGPRPELEKTKLELHRCALTQTKPIELFIYQLTPLSCPGVRVRLFV
jgi:hypothetical protein